jgi:hypothetical protein
MTPSHRISETSNSSMRKAVVLERPSEVKSFVDIVIDDAASVDLELNDFDFNLPEYDRPSLNEMKMGFAAGEELLDEDPNAIFD